MMKIHKCEGTFVLEKYAHNVLQGSLACSKVLITYEPLKICGSHHLCTFITSFFMINGTQTMPYNKRHSRSMEVYISTTLFLVFSVTSVKVSLTLV